MERRNRWMAIAAFVLVTVSFRPWYAYGLGTAVDASNAWGSPRWAAAALAGVAAVLVWFGTVARLPERSRPIVAAALLVVGLGLMAQEGMHVLHRTYTITTVSFRDLNGNLIGGTDPAQADTFHIDFRPAHHVAVATLAGMLALALTAVAPQLRPGAGRRPAGA